MAYQCDPPGNDWLRQGEILQGLIELRATPAQDCTKEDVKAEVDWVEHPLAVVVSQDCDLEWDYKARRGSVASHKLLTHVLFCDLYEPTHVRTRERAGSDIWKRITQNQDERYHFFAPVYSESGEEVVPSVIMDFKSYFSVPADSVYAQLEQEWAARRGILPVPHRYAVSHRLMGFLGRVALPAEEQES